MNLSPEEVALVSKWNPLLPPVTLSAAPTRAETPSPKVRLFVQTYQSPNPKRQEELDYCLRENKANPHFEVIELPAHDRLTFREFFEEANKVAGPDDVSIFANSDIRFDESASLFRWLSPDEAWSLSRWVPKENHPESRKIPHTTSEVGADVWAVRGRVKFVPDCDFGMGLHYCDYAITERLIRAGYAVFNPVWCVRAWHEHASAFRTYKSRPEDAIPRPWTTLHPSHLIEWAKGRRQGIQKKAISTHQPLPPPKPDMSTDLARFRAGVCTNCKFCKRCDGGAAMIGPQGVQCSVQGCRWYDISNPAAVCGTGKW